MNLVRRLLTGALAIAPAVAAAQGPKLSVPYTLDTLPNGLTVIVHEDHAVPIVTVNIWFHVGSGDEKPGRTGFAHLFEHLMFMGSQHAEYPMFDRMLEAAGREQQRLDRQRRHRLLRSRAIVGASAHALARRRPHGLAPADHGQSPRSTSSATS